MRFPVFLIDCSRALFLGISNIKMNTSSNRHAVIGSLIYMLSILFILISPVQRFYMFNFAASVSTVAYGIFLY